MMREEKSELAQHPWRVIGVRVVRERERVVGQDLLFYWPADVLLEGNG
jgi:hypothetical protein